jgi:diguanylate cyclase (GGDEF)-like protein
MTSPASDLAQCASEPIHIPGAIQPHGAVLIVSADTLIVTHASANLAIFLGHTPAAVLGSCLPDIIGEATCRALLGAEILDAATPSREHRLPGPHGTALHLRAHRTGGVICLDIQPDGVHADQPSPFAQLRSVLESFKNAASSDALCDCAVRGFRRISGYDRVMAYRFDADGNGEVVAEALAPGLESYLGLHYPAGDVPPQSRVLSLRQRVGAIADTSYTPVPLLPDPALNEPVAVDLTRSSLRSVSPLHRQYLRNMDTAATLTIAITDGPHLWGIIACQHVTAKIANPALRSVADSIGQVVSLLICTLSEAERHAAQLARDAMLLAISDRLAAQLSLAEALHVAQSDLLTIVAAAGAIVRVAGTVFHVGQTPPEAERLLDGLMAHNTGELDAINDLSLRHPVSGEAHAGGSGVLLLPLGGRRDNADAQDQDNEDPGGLDAVGGAAILWFRPKRVVTVTWGGNPAEHTISDPLTGELSPRHSFAAWKETVAGSCLPWTQADQTMARRLRAAIESAVAQRTKAELARLRHYDALTGLPNRSLLQERLTEIGLEPAAPTALLFLDLDRFKAVNDTMGHAAGDALLIEVARRLVAIAEPHHLAARLGGDEFVVLCRGLEPDAVSHLAERIRTSVEAPFEIAGRPCHIAASIGTATVGQLGGLDLIRAADMAMYAAKQRGGNRGVVFEAALFDRATQQYELEIDLRSALATGDQFVLLYQPVFDILSGTNTLVGFEALVRWKHPAKGWMSPALFIPLAEKSGLILPLGDWVLATAVRQARTFRLAYRGAEISMAVNISALQLPQPGFCASVADLLEAEGLPPSALCLEVTESMLTDNAASRVLADIRALGASVAIDDFGMGFSSLSYLQRVPADVVKLDRSFLDSVKGQSPDTEFVSAVITLAHAAGKTVVFEGIETSEQFDIALHAGADMVQGFFFAPPLSANAAQGLVDQHAEIVCPFGPGRVRRTQGNKSA